MGCAYRASSPDGSAARGERGGRVREPRGDHFDVVGGDDEAIALSSAADRRFRIGGEDAAGLAGRAAGGENPFARLFMPRVGIGKGAERKGEVAGADEHEIDAG